jgi:hypothetical protein
VSLDFEVLGGSLRPTILSPPIPAQAHRLGMLPGRELMGPLRMLSSPGSQRPALVSNVLVHSRDIEFDLGNRLGQGGDLPLERLTLRAGLLGARAQLRPVWLRIGHGRN